MLAETWIVAPLPPSLLPAPVMASKTAMSQSMATEQARGEVVLRAIVRHLVLFYYGSHRNIFSALRSSHVRRHVWV